MNDCTFRDCDGCTDRVLCHCLQVTEATVRHALDLLDLSTVKQVREATGAGDGCTACHRRLRGLLEQKRRAELAQPASSSVSPI